MTVGRRNFLRLFAASPLMAKAAADKAIAEVTNIGGAGLVGLGSGGSPMAAPSQSGSERASKVASFLRRFGLPDWEVERIKVDNHHVYQLDPDIAALKSFSMNVKIATQRERNVARQVERLQGQSAYEELRDDFRKKHGFWFWW